MNQTTYALLAVGAGVCIAIQAPANSRLGATLRDPLLATFFSVCGTFLTVVAVMLAVRPPLPTADAVRQTQWWNWIGGPLGVLFVLAGAVLVPRLGAALYVALVVGGQLVFSLAADHFALVGLPQQPITAGRVLGALLVVAGVVCLKYL